MERSLRHSREMTLLCSPKVTHHHSQLGGVVSPGKSVLSPHGKCCVGWRCRPQRSILSPAHAASSCDVSALRAFVALDGHRQAVVSVAWSADKRRALSGSYDQTMCLWDAEMGRRRMLEGHSGTVYCLAWSTDQRCALSGSGD